MLRQAHDLNREYRELLEREQDHARVAEGEARMWERLRDSASNKCDELVAENKRLREQLAKTGVVPEQQALSEKPSNVVPLVTNSSAAIDRPLHERC
jgi:hypothetical protein